MSVAETLNRELAFSERIIRAGHEVVPRFRVLSCEGEFHLMVPLPPDAEKRQQALRLAATFMALKMAHAFILSSETVSPDAIIAVAVSREGVEGIMRRISREPLAFGPPERVPAPAVGGEILALLPPVALTLGTEQLDELAAAMAAGQVMRIEEL